MAIQGFGNVGSHAAKFLDEAGAKIVAVSGSSGGWHNKDGLDIQQMWETMQSSDEPPPIADLDVDGMAVENHELLELDVDILIPAAIGGTITQENVDNVAATLIVEGANVPITYEADQQLRDKEIMVVPDVLANAGGGDRLLF